MSQFVRTRNLEVTNCVLKPGRNINEPNIPCKLKLIRVVINIKYDSVAYASPIIKMKNILMIFMITGTCMVLLKCKNDDDSAKNNVLQYSYQLTLSFNYESWPAATFNWTLTDMATMDINVKDSIISISNIQNQEGSVSPATHSIQNGIETCTATWLQGESPSGYIHITGGSGELYLGGDQNIMLSLHVTSSNTKTPRFNYVCTRSGSSASGGESLEPHIYNYTFSLNNQIQTQSNSSLTATLTPE